MTCGTPVFRFDTGGIPDMVRPGETGWLAETGSVRTLREAIEQALSHDDKCGRLVKRCRAVVENEYTLEHQARRYRDLYEETLQWSSVE
jgi:glycosyltransferase involved in cell wall biosynthesis